MKYKIIVKIEGTNAPALRIGDIAMKIDPDYFRPAEVENLLGDPSKAKEKLGWAPEITVQEICKEMVAEDLKEAKRQALLKANNFNVNVITD